jgi:hypothetical protein
MQVWSTTTLCCLVSFTKAFLLIISYTKTELHDRKRATQNSICNWFMIKSYFTWLTLDSSKHPVTFPGWWWILQFESSLSHFVHWEDLSQLCYCIEDWTVNLILKFKIMCTVKVVVMLLTVYCGEVEHTVLSFSCTVHCTSCYLIQRDPPSWYSIVI